MRNIVISLITLILAGLLIILSSCLVKQSDKAVSSVGPLPQNKEAAVKSGDARELEWDKWLVEAKKEGRLVVLATGETAPHKAVKEGFEKKFGISVEIISSGVGLVRGKLLSERRAGIYTTDLIFSGGTTAISLKSESAYDPVEKIPVLPEVLDSRVWWKDKLDYIDKDRFIITFLATPSVPLAINTELVRLDEEPRTWKDLLHPRWKGKIIMGDPRIAGTASSTFAFVAYYRPDLGINFWKELVSQEPVILRDQRMQVEWLARGKHAILIAPPPTVKQFIDSGAPLKWVMLEGKGAASSSSGNVAMVNKAPHPNAARVYINYLLTKEGQTGYAVTGGFQSGRVDVTTGHLLPIQVRQPGVEYVFTSYESIAMETLEAMKVAAEIFAQ